jgi:predicted phosphodiesterase
LSSAGLFPYTTQAMSTKANSTAHQHAALFPDPPWVPPVWIDSLLNVLTLLKWIGFPWVLLAGSHYLRMRGVVAGPWLSYGTMAVIILYIGLHWTDLGLLSLSLRLRAFLFGSAPRRTVGVAFHGILTTILCSAWYLLGHRATPGLIWQAAFLDTVRLYVAFTAGWEGVRLLGSLFAESAPLRLEPLELEKTRSEDRQRGHGKHAREVTVAHWTDLHLTCGPGAARVEGGSGGNEALRQLLAQYHQELCKKTDAILVTGDITDTGAEEEWQAFLHAIPGDLFPKLVLVPGNHELNIPAQTSGTWAGKLRADLLAYRPNRVVRLLRCLLALERVQGQRAFLLDPQMPTRLLSLSAYMGELKLEVQRHVSSLEKLGRPLGWDAVDAADVVRGREYVLDQAFPMAVQVEGTELVFIVLNSNDRSINLATNAFGYVKEAQLRRLPQLIDCLGSQPYVVAMHHHLGIPFCESTVYAALAERAMTIINATYLVEFLKMRRPTVLFNGHRHIRYVAQVGDTIQVIAGPSTTLGDELPSAPSHRPGFSVFTLRWTSLPRGVRVHNEQFWGLDQRTPAGRDHPPSV